MILGLFWMAVANAASLLGAHEILRRFRTGRASLDATLFLILRLGLISATVLAAGLGHFLTPIGVGVFGAVALGALLLGGAHRRLPAFRRPSVNPWLAFFLAALAVRFLLQVWFFAPHTRDVFLYHLPKIGEWIQHSGFTREAGLDPRCTFPAGFELIETWWVVFLRHDVLIESAGLEFILLAFFATHALARELGLSDRVAQLGAALFIATPGISLQAVSCLNDAPAMTLVVATTAFSAGRCWPGLILAAGLGIGLKPTYVYTLPGVALFHLLHRPSGAAAPAPVRWIVPLTVAALLIGGSWYARNAWLFGNPIHPVNREGFKFSGGSSALQLGPNPLSLWHNARRLIDVRIDDHKNPYGSELDQISGWGVVGYGCGLVALLICLRADPRLRPLAVGMTVSMACVFTLVISDYWYLRFVLFFPALLAVAAARMTELCPGVGAVLGSALAVQFLGTMVPAELPVGGLSDLVRQNWSERRIFIIPQMEVPGNAIGCAGTDMVRAYALYQPDFSRRVVYIRADSAEGLVAALDREGLKALYATPSMPIVQQAVERGLLKRAVGWYYLRP